MEGVAAKVGAALATEIGELVGLIFDGWSHASFHYIGIFAVYEVNGKRYQPLLGVSPLEEGQQDANAHIRLMYSVFAVYNKTIDMARFLVADNCATNKTIATKLGIPLVDCASDMFNLAANKLYADSEDLLGDVNSLMAKAAESQQLRRAGQAHGTSPRETQRDPLVFDLRYDGALHSHQGREQEGGGCRRDGANWTQRSRGMVTLRKSRSNLCRSSRQLRTVSR
jgi:hypothetical protein